MHEKNEALKCKYLRYLKTWIYFKRRIDKILQEILDQAWDILEKRETERQIESSKYRPPKFSSHSVIDVSLKV